MLSVVRREFKILLLETSVSSVSSLRVARVVDDFVHKTPEPKKVWSAYKNIISANDRELVLNIFVAFPLQMKLNFIKWVFLV